MDKFKTKNFKIVKIKGFYRLKFVGKRLSLLTTLEKKFWNITTIDDYDDLMRYIIRNNKICYVYAWGYDIMPQLYVTNNNKIYSVRKWYEKFDKNSVINLKKKITQFKRYTRSKEFKKKTIIEQQQLKRKYLSPFCTIEEAHVCIKYIINECKKLNMNTILIPMSIRFEDPEAYHANLLLIKGKKAWRMDPVINNLPEINNYLKKQFKKIGINYQGYIYNVGQQSICGDKLCKIWILYFAFYYGLNKKFGFDDIIFYTKREPEEELKYQMRMFLAYILELLKKIKKST